MTSEIQNKDSTSVQKKKVRIGSPVPVENREWLKHHGIVTDQTLSSPGDIYSTRSTPPIFSFKRVIQTSITILLLVLPFAGYQYFQKMANELQNERERFKSMEAANFHLRGGFTALSSLNSVQQSEINRLSTQIQGMSERFRMQVGGFQKGEAMYDALQHTYDHELVRLSRQYDLEVDALQKQVQSKDQMISSLETSLAAMDGVVVRADPIADGNGMPSTASVASINFEFQFIIIDAGQLKGAQLGQMIEIQHAGAIIGYGQIEKIYPEYSGVRVFLDETMTRIQKGDSVFLQNMPVF